MLKFMLFFYDTMKGHSCGMMKCHSCGTMKGHSCGMMKLNTA